MPNELAKLLSWETLKPLKKKPKKLPLPKPKKD
jgi:hypothetical protein